MPTRIGVFCGSSLGANFSYRAATAELAKSLVANRISIVYGGSSAGLMGVLADQALKAGGEVIGVIPKAMVDKEVAHRGLSDLQIVASMHERKALMAEMSDAFIALPGGYGTLEEFCEVLTWSQLGLHRKACGLVNTQGYYDHLLALFDHAVKEQFVKPLHRQMIVSDSDPEKLITRLLACQVPQVSKWLDNSAT